MEDAEDIAKVNDLTKHSWPCCPPIWSCIYHDKPCPWYCTATTQRVGQLQETPGALSPERRPPPPDAGPAPAVSSPRLANTASDVSMDELEGLVPPIRPLRHEFSDIGLDIQRILGEDAAASVARPKSSESR